MARIRQDADAVTIGMAIHNIEKDNHLTADALMTLASVTFALLAQVMTLNQAVLDLNAGLGHPINQRTKSQLMLFRED